MSKSEADKAGLPSPHGYFRVEQGKANMGPPQRATWRRMVTLELGNATATYPDGDSVGVVTTWAWPDALDGVSVSDLEKVKAALASGSPRASDQSPDWAGCEVGKLLALDVGPPKKGDRSREQQAARARVREIISNWKKTGDLVEVAEHSSRAGRSVTCIRPHGWTGDAAPAPNEDVDGSPENFIY